MCILYGNIISEALKFWYFKDFKLRIFEVVEAFESKSLVLVTTVSREILRRYVEPLLHGSMKVQSHDM